MSSSSILPGRPITVPITLQRPMTPDQCPVRQPKPCLSYGSLSFIHWRVVATSVAAAGLLVAGLIGTVSWTAGREPSTQESKITHRAAPPPGKILVVQFDPYPEDVERMVPAVPDGSTAPAGNHFRSSKKETPAPPPEKMVFEEPRPAAPSLAAHAFSWPVPQLDRWGSQPALPIREVASSESRRHRENFGTSVEFVSNPLEAARQAIQERKLLFVLHVSGNFEEAKFT